jgi:hypothetical protein
MNRSEEMSGARFVSEPSARAAVAGEVMNAVLEVVVPKEALRAVRRVERNPGTEGQEAERLVQWTRQERGRVVNIIRGKPLIER